MSGARFRLDQLPPKAQAEALAILGQTSRPLDSTGAKAKETTIRQNRGPRLNKLATAYLERLIEVHGEEKVLVEAINLDLANCCRYRPDFWVVQTCSVYGGNEMAVSLSAFEVKGNFAWEDSIVKLKVAARAYPWIKFYLCTREGRTGGWSEKRVFS